MRLLACLLCILGTARATSIVILRFPDRIYIGADSRRTYRAVRETYTDSVCKIVPAGRFWFVASGLTYANGRQVADAGVAAGRSSPTSQSALEAFRAQMAAFLPLAIVAQGRIEQSGTRTGDGLLLEGAFAGFNNSLSEVSVEWFRASSAHSVRTDRRVYSGPSQRDRPEFIFLGKRRAIDQRLANGYPAIRTRREAAAFIRDMISLEAAESPGNTAGPIDILEVRSRSSEWIQRKAFCGVD